MTGKIVVVSLGGSLIAPKEGFDVKFLKNFKNLIVGEVKKGRRFIIVCGGGQTARSYQAVARTLSGIAVEDIDWIGIHSTRLNAHLMRTVFRQWSNPKVVADPTKKIKWAEPILIGAGWKPGWSTDYVAVKLAGLYGSKVVINLSNVDYVYDKDPKKFANAKKFPKLSWKDFRKIVGNKWIPGANVPFDPVASKEGERLGLKVYFAKGTNLGELKKMLDNGKFKGTVIE